MSQRVLDSFFGASKAKPFYRGDAWPEEPIRGDGPLRRFPDFFQNGALSGLDRLCSVYSGQLRLSSDYGQVRVSGEPWSLFQSGNTVFFEDVIPSVPSLRDWVSFLERDVGLPQGRLRVAAFASPAGRGLKLHFDVSDTILLQVRGRKRFTLAANPHLPHPTAQYWPDRAILDESLAELVAKEPAPARATTLTLRSGTALFIPRGYWHASVAETDSFAVSLIFDWPLALDLLLRGLRYRLLQSPRWRRAVYGAWREGANRAALAELDTLVRALPASLESLDATELVCSLLDERDVASRIEYEGAQTSFVRLRSTKVVFRDHNDEGQDVVLFSDRGDQRTDLTVPARFIPAFKWIASQRGTFTIADIPKEADYSNELFSILSEAELIRPVPFRRSRLRRV